MKHYLNFILINSVTYFEILDIIKKIQMHCSNKVTEKTPCLFRQQNIENSMQLKVFMSIWGSWNSYYIAVYAGTAITLYTRLYPCIWKSLAMDDDHYNNNYS
ncbi:conserved hypothetical protein [Trichinella spiralis]|uniref:hypothetical protein n=1 Tax=Trichinella spiralis TaxID=6334 RepID=UPI0001EFBB9E|nr:conserved hypothetical protein [Trichinella spiralis]